MPKSIHKQYGLIGYPLSHSFSPSYFKNKFEKEQILNCQYDLFPLEQVDLFCGILEKKNIAGINVTIPYKEQVIPFLDDLDETASEIGAVNTIQIHQGRTKGFNTDVFGFEQSLLPLLKAHHQKALILGTGGASKAVAYVLKKLAIDYLFVSRKATAQQLTYDAIDKSIVSEYKLIINTTPLGMAPKIETAPNLPYQLLGKDHLLYDLIYNPSTTLFMQKGQDQGAMTKNGLEMLQLQAEESWRIWNHL